VPPQTLLTGASPEPQRATSVLIDCFGVTDRGRVRPANEDQYLIADVEGSMLIQQTSLAHEDRSRWFAGAQGKLLVVADGMGGHAAGERASTIAVDALTEYVLHTLPWFFGVSRAREDDMLGVLGAAMNACQQKIEQESAKNGELQGMGTTLTMAYIIWPRMYVVHAGDSRCYLVRGGRITQLTTDHTVAEQFVEQGALTPEQAQKSRYSHVLYNCIGGGTADLQPEVRKATLEVGDTLLLCTDGLSKYVKDDDLVASVTKQGNAESRCRDLLKQALDAGGADNITAIVASFSEPR
jgi:PPM family protein phosphatase